MGQPRDDARAPHGGCEGADEVGERGAALLAGEGGGAGEAGVKVGEERREGEIAL